MKTVLLGKERRWEGSESRLFNVILRWDCGSISYQRRAKGLKSLLTLPVVAAKTMESKVN